MLIDIRWRGCHIGIEFHGLGGPLGIITHGEGWLIGSILQPFLIFVGSRRELLEMLTHGSNRRIG